MKTNQKLIYTTFRSFTLPKRGGYLPQVLKPAYKVAENAATLFNGQLVAFRIVVRLVYGQTQGQFFKKLEDCHRLSCRSGLMKNAFFYHVVKEADAKFASDSDRVHYQIVFYLPGRYYTTGSSFWLGKMLPKLGHFMIPDYFPYKSCVNADWSSPSDRENLLAFISYDAKKKGKLKVSPTRFIRTCSFRKFKDKLGDRKALLTDEEATDLRGPFIKPELPSAEIMELAFGGKEKASPCAENFAKVSVRRKASCARKTVSDYFPLPSLPEFSLRQEDVNYGEAFPEVDSEFVSLPEPISADVVGERTSTGEVDSLELVSDFAERDLGQSQRHVFDPDLSKLLVVGSKALAVADDPARSLAYFTRVRVENELPSADVVARLIVAAEHSLGQVEVAHRQFVVEPAGASWPPQEREADRAVGNEVVHVVVDLASTDRVGADQVGVHVVDADDFSGHFKPVIPVEREVEGVVTPNLKSVFGKFDDGIVDGVVKLFAGKLDGNERVAEFAVNPVAELVARPDVALVRHESFGVGMIRNNFFGLRIFNGNDPPLTVFGVINELSRGVFGDQQRVEPGDVRSVVSKNDNSSKLLSRDFDHRFVIRAGRQNNVKARAPADHEIIGRSLVVSVHFDRIVALATFNFGTEEARNVWSDDLPSLLSSAVAQLHRSKFVFDVEPPIGAVDEVVTRSVNLNRAGNVLHRDFDERTGSWSFRQNDFNATDVADDQVVRRSRKVCRNFNRNVAALDDLLRLRWRDEPPNVVLCVEDKFSRAVAFTEFEDRVVADRRAGGRNDRNWGLDELGCDFDGSEALRSFRQRNHQPASETDDQIGRLGLKRFRSFHGNVTAPLLAFSSNVELDAPDSFNRIEDRQIDDEIFLFPADGQLLRRVVSPIGSIEYEPIFVVVELNDRFSFNRQLRLGENEPSSRIQIGIAEGKFVGSKDDAA